MPGLWDSVKRGASRAAAEAEKQAAVAKLSVEISQANGKIRDKLEEMGKASLSLYREGTIDHATLEPFVVEISNLEGRVKEIEKQIASIRETPAGDG